MGQAHPLATRGHFHKSHLALHPHSLSDHRTHQIFQLAMANGSHLSGALGALMSSRFQKNISPGKGVKINLVTSIVIGTLLCIIAICCFGIIFLQPTDFTSTPTPAPQISIEQMIIMTSAAAQTQTMAAASPVPTFTLSSDTTQLTLAPTWTPAPTDTPFILTLVTYPASDAGGQCVCSQDLYNCGDPLDQVCFNACNAQGAGDIHKLDQNNNGIACEGD